MAGIEQLEIHSKSYLVRWVNVKGGHTISWSVKPEKKSINFGIFKHPASGQTLASSVPSSTFEPPPTPGFASSEDVSKEPQPTRNAHSTASEKLKSFGLKSISWYGACESNRVSSGTYDVPREDGGMYALVFDNTFSKQVSKKATFVLLTYPTDAPPQSVHHHHHDQVLALDGSGSSKDTPKFSPSLVKYNSSEMMKKPGTRGSDDARRSDESRGKKLSIAEESGVSNLFNGVLQKRRRKKHQGWARRFFSLDFRTQTLSYYHDRNTRALRGTVPLSLAAIGANSKTRQISIDSGAEIWHLKASNDHDFQAWKDALELARTPLGPSSPATGRRPQIHSRTPSMMRANPQEEREWAKVETLITRIKSSRDEARTIAKDTDPKYLPIQTVSAVSFDRMDPHLTSGASSQSQSPSEQSLNGYFGPDPAAERRPFWKRKPSSDRPMPGMFKRSVSAAPSVTPQRSAPPTPGTIATSSNGLPSHPEESVHDQCMALLKHLDAIVIDFNELVQESKQRRMPVLSSAMSRQSIESQGSDEFFDAQGYEDSQLLAIQPESEDEIDGKRVAVDDESGSDSDLDEPTPARKSRPRSRTVGKAFPSRPESLYPLPTDAVKRRTTIAPPKMPPPSLIGFVRKNVGKDLSTISMPVSANEPTSLVQRISEALEYSHLLDSAASAQIDSAQRLLYISAFAISMLSGARCKERALRKPFNPMLGETFELVREDRGFRFLAEKVTHHPVRMACQADSEKWCLTQAPLPSQKFWGKSAEIVTEGKYRINLHATGDHFSWSPATSFLRNIIAGEKYVEPVGAMNVFNETSGERAVVTFKSKGMFSGRSEDVVVQLYNLHGEEASLGLVGKWTSSLHITENGNPRLNAIWSVGDLVPDANKRYGFTAFAATLNEITSLEKGKVAPTDSRLRPDQRAAEDGDLDRAETLKTKLEEAQRARRRQMEETGKTWQPRWFRKLDAGEDVGEEIWIANAGADSYWEQRKQGNWNGVEEIFTV